MPQEPAYLECFTQSLGILPRFAWRTSVRF